MFQNLQRCYIIAEIGGNFTTFEEAAALIDAAKECGVDCVKLQTYTAETIVTKSAYFDMENTGRIRQYDYFRSFELSPELHARVVSHIATTGLDWFSSPSHETDLDLLLDLGVKAIKIGADDANNLPFLANCARTGLPVVLSTGMCTLAEVRDAVDTILACGNSRIVILHTVSGYPTQARHVNLRILDTYRREFPGMYVGFSDHTLSPLACIAAATMGADVVERHFTLDKKAHGPDHVLSATPEEMRYLVESIREIETMKGDGIKMPRGAEVANRGNNRKSLHAARPLREGDVVTAADVKICRPGHGMEPKLLGAVLGRRTARDVAEDTALSWGDFR